MADNTARRGLGGLSGFGRRFDDPIIDVDDLPHPIDPDEFRQIQLLNEASLVSFTADPPRLPPFGRATLAWQIAMPTTELPGVHVDALLHQPNVDPEIVAPEDSRPVSPYAMTRYDLSLRAPKATRYLGKLELDVDIAACTSVETAAGVFTKLATDQADAAFPAGGEVHLRGGGSSVDLGVGSFVVDLPLTASVPNWFDADVDVSMGFEVGSRLGQLRVGYTSARTSVTFGVGSSILSLGCDEAVEKAVEVVTTGLLDSFIGPVIAQRIAWKLQEEVDKNLRRLNTASPAPAVPFRLYQVLLDADGLIYRYCPSKPSTPGSPGGGSVPGGNLPVGPG